MDLRLFKQDDLFNATLSFFRDTIGLQLQTKSRMPVDLKNQFEDRGIKSKKVEEVWSHVDKTYYIGLLDDDNFHKEIAEQEESDLQEDLEEVGKSDDEYPGILIFAVDLNEGFNPTRSNLTEINRTLNRFSQRVPALVLARYGNKISLMLADRVAYKQEWREGEKVRKVSLLRDIILDDPHAGHLRILKDLVVPTSGTKEVENFEGLYEYWKEVLDTSELNKKFYQDLSNWYFWAIKHVRFPDEPTAEDAHEQNKELDDMLQEHRATNVIRLLTRLLFVWFIKEKGLIPEELFDLKTLQKDILEKITPHHEHGMFKEANKESIYYKAILQNLFFATLNCPIEASSTDNRERGFRSTTRGVHFGVTYLMRYEKYFEDKDAFLELVNSKVPFLNGGLFECLDIRGEKEDKEDRVWVDGFSDNLPNEHSLIVPDFLFFGVEEEVDLSEDYGLKSKKYKEAAVRGLLNIFKSYKFTITENTPIEEDVALDPELLGKVFENLLASYNPETKTTARKQTGSFYTPREIVNYMVDESLIAYLKNAVEGWGVSEEELDEKLHQLTSYEETVPFEGDKELHREVITALSKCTILDPACGSGAFPMGILQKMVHILQKLDTENEVWKMVQKEKASKEADQAISEIADKEERGQRLQEINEAFDERMNAPNYARKLFLIENCIYGVDIQPVATQISKLRFFISLVVEQKVGEDKSNNFGIRPLPNLETKFVTANTLIDIKDNSNQTSLYETDKIKKLEADLKQIRSKLFSARTTVTKYKYRQEDEQLRNEIAEELKQTGWPNDAADKLASWDPYDQNASSSFFNSEWMFDVTNGFDVIIGNPPYVDSEGMVNTGQEWLREYLSQNYNYTKGNWDLYIAFFERGFDLAKNLGSLTYITPDKWLAKPFGKELRKGSLKNLYKILRSGRDVFESVGVDSIVTLFINKPTQHFDFLDKKDSVISKVDSINKDIIESPFQLDIVFSKYLKLLIDVTDRFSPMTEELEVMCENACATSDCYILKDILLDSDGDYNSSDYYKVINTGTVDKYHSRWGKKEMTYLKDKYLNPVVLKTDFHQTFQNSYAKKTVDPKIIIKGLTLLDASLDLEADIIPGKSTLIIRSNNVDKLILVSAFVNSKFAQFYITERYSASSYNTGVNFTKSMINNLPIPHLENYEIDLLQLLVRKLLDTDFEKTDKIEKHQEFIDAIVLNVYLKEYLKKKEINLSSIIKQDISRHLGSKDYSSLSQQEKNKTIESLLEIWTDPEYEVRKRINSFPEKSPEILKPILEG